MRKLRTPGRLVAVLFLCATAASAQSRRALVKSVNANGQDNNYKATILVSNEEDEAPLQDILLVNAWGIAASSTGPWWVADNGSVNGSAHSTVYDGDGNKQAPEPNVPGAPTGIVHNDSGSFQLVAGTPASFIFASEDGTFSAWAFTVDFNNAIVVHSEDGAIYKGMAIHGDRLYSTDFGGCSVDAYEGDFFNQSFEEIDTAGGFADPSIDQGYCPFGIRVIGDSVFVTYALKEGEDDVPGIGHGFVREFDTDGNLVAKIGSHGLLNSPWGLAMAPPDFGRFGGCLIVGNFGDGKLNAFCQNPAGEWHHAGRLRHGQHALSVDGLWGIGFGNGAASGDPNILYFAAGPDEETNGYFGKIEFDPHHSH
jgi:uncharacterized protein (TIGR03118 family)